MSGGKNVFSDLFRDFLGEDPPGGDLFDTGPFGHPDQSFNGVVIECPCGAKNRAGHRGQGTYKCGKCKMPIPSSVINAKLREKLGR